MKVAMINLADSGGGAAMVASQLARHLEAKGHLVTFYCALKSKEESVRLGGWANWLVGRVCRRIGFADIVMPSSLFLSRLPAIRDADIIHLHNLHDFYFGVSALKELARMKPCVWTFHDLWPVTGGCHSGKYWKPLSGAEECDGWKRGCKDCPGYGTFPLGGIVRTTALQRGVKEQAINAVLRSGGQLTFVSRWLKNRVLEMTRKIAGMESQSHVVRNTVDEAMRPKERMKVRSRLGIADAEFTFLVPSADLSNRWKGVETVRRALQRLGSIKATVIAVGGGGLPFEGPHNLRVIEVGYVQSREALSDLYSAADITVVTSWAETFCLVAAESIACGTPVVAANSDAISEIVDSNVGLLFQPGNVDELAELLKTLHGDYGMVRRLQDECRRTSATRFANLQDWAAEYVGVYARAIASKV